MGTFIASGGSLPVAKLDTTMRERWDYSDFDALQSWATDLRTAVVNGLSPIIITAVPGITVNANRPPNIGKLKITIAASVWTAAATTQDISIFTCPAKTRVRSAMLDVTEAYAGLAGTIQLRLGKTTGGAEYIAAADVKSAIVTLGAADADMGTAMTRAAAIQGGDIPSWSAGTNIKIRLASGTGNIGDGAATNLSAGIVTVILTLEDLS